MDWIAGKEVLREGFRKYRYVLLAALLGVFLMLLPVKEEALPESEPEALQPVPDLQTELSALLSRVEGAGKVEVLLTQKEGAQTVYQNDEQIQETDIRRDTVLVTDAARSETGLIRQVNPPVYRGAVIVCQGADQSQVRLAMVLAVKSATGLSADQITVLKMK